MSIIEDLRKIAKDQRFHASDDWDDSETIDRAADEIELLRTALERIAANAYGLQGIVEDYGHDTNAYNFHAMEYWYQDAMRRKSIANEALNPRDKHPDEIQTSNK